MEHLTRAIEKLARNHGIGLTNSFLGGVLKYLATGDETLMPLLLKINEPDMNKLSAIAKAVPRPDEFSEADRRLVHFFARRSALLNGTDTGKLWGECSDWPLARCLARHLENEKPGENLCERLHAELRVNVPEPLWTMLVARHFEPRVVKGRLTSAGRFLATRPVAQLLHVLPAIRYRCQDRQFMPAFAAEFPGELGLAMDELVRREKVSDLPRGGWEAALETDAARFESRVVAAFGLMGELDDEEKSNLARSLEKHFPGKYRQRALEAAGHIGAALGGEAQAAAARWLIEQQGGEAVPAITDYIAGWNLENPGIAPWKVEVLSECARLLGRAIKPALEAAMQKDLPQLRHGALELWIAFRDPADDAALEKQLLAELAMEDPAWLIHFIPLAASWNLPRVAPRLWELIGHKSKPVRETAAQALSKLGDHAAAKAEVLLSARRMDLRKAAVALLIALGTERARHALQSQLARESTHDVRDAIQNALAGLAATPPAPRSVPVKADAAQSLKPSRKQMEELIASMAPKIKGWPADWIQESSLPPLHFADGKAFHRDALRYLLYRQAREKDMAADIEAAQVYALIDRATSGDFALAILNRYCNSNLDAKDRWALALAGLLGDDRVVPILTRKIAEWTEASRGKLAEYAVQALALLASDAALLAVDAMAIRYRTKFKNIGQAAAQAFAAAADARGLSPAELGDRVLPWLGFEPCKPRVLEFGGNRIEVSIGLDFKPVWRDLVKNKTIKTLPASAPDEIKAAMKELSAGLKEAGKAQVLRMENLMVRQHRWPARRWAELFLRHPVIFPFAARLVWGVFGETGKLAETFRALEDRSLTNPGDEPVPRPETGRIGIVHPLELTPEAREEWLMHLADYDVVPPFAQLERPVVTATAEQVETKLGDEVAGTELNGLTFKGRAERLGWARGSVCDAGSISCYFKSFPAAGVDVFLETQGMCVGIDMYSDIQLGKVFFVKHGSVQIGGYVYDEPNDGNDPRLVSFGAVPAIAFSEALGDLAKISGKSAAQKTEEANA